MRRLYPVSFRSIEQDQQFKKWQWIEVVVSKATTDRPESHKVDIGTLLTKDEVTTKQNWAERREWIDRMPTFASYDEIEQARKDGGGTIALLRPKRRTRSQDQGRSPQGLDGRGKGKAETRPDAGRPVFRAAGQAAGLRSTQDHRGVGEQLSPNFTTQ